MKQNPKSKPVAVFDIDGTIIRSSLVIELTNELIKQGIFPIEAKTSYEKEQRNWLNRHGSYGEYLWKLVDTYEKHANGCKQADIKKVAYEVATQHTFQTYRYTRELIKTLSETHFLLAISGSPIEVVEPFAKAHGFDLAHGTVKQTKNGVYINEWAFGFKNKDKTLRGYVREHGLTFKGSVGVGDTENDASFLKIVDEAIAFNPNAELFEVAKENNWKVVIERKDVIYELTQENGKYVLN